jgi:hypothetical protein
LHLAELTHVHALILRVAFEADVRDGGADVGGRFGLAVSVLPWDEV